MEGVERKEELVRLGRWMRKDWKLKGGRCKKPPPDHGEKGWRLDVHEAGSVGIGWQTWASKLLLRTNPNGGKFKITEDVCPRTQCVKRPEAEFWRGDHPKPNGPLHVNEMNSMFVGMLPMKHLEPGSWQTP